MASEICGVFMETKTELQPVCKLSTSQRHAWATLDYTVQCSPTMKAPFVSLFTLNVSIMNYLLNILILSQHRRPPPLFWSCFLQVQSNLQRAAVSKLLILAAPIIVVCLPILWGKIKGRQQVQCYFRRSHLSYCVRIILTVCVCASQSASPQAAEER